MDMTFVIDSVRQFGPPGMLLAFMVWDRMQQAKLSVARTEADLSMARAMTILAERIK